MNNTDQGDKDYGSKQFPTTTHIKKAKTKSNLKVMQT